MLFFRLILCFSLSFSSAYWHCHRIDSHIASINKLLSFFLDEDISLTEEELRESLQNGSISEAQVIEACQVEMEGEEEQNMMQIETDMDTEDSLSMAMT